ncbi:fibronectin type-III domain-containing protein [Trichonephila clavipes]|nr:fibronectin type-III domain-containing protein [Trichonephila clavipes]
MPVAEQKNIVEILMHALDPRPKLTITVEPNGVVKVSSDILLAKGRGKEKVDLAVFQIEPETLVKRTVWVLEGLAQEVNITSLEPGGEYWIEMTPREGRRFNYSGSFKACKREIYKESERARRGLDLREPFLEAPPTREIIREPLYLSPRSKAEFGTVEIAKQHGGFGASKLTQTRCGITESEPFLRILCIGLSPRVPI